jgi:hypothetical protein
MNAINSSSTFPFLLFFLSVAILFVLLLLRFILFFHDFLRKWRYLTSEINRTNGLERRYWILLRKRLVRSLCPFTRR